MKGNTISYYLMIRFLILGISSRNTEYVYYILFGLMKNLRMKTYLQHLLITGKMINTRVVLPTSLHNFPWMENEENFTWWQQLEIYLLK